MVGYNVKLERFENVQGFQSPYRLAMSGVVLSAERVGFAISEKGEG